MARTWGLASIMVCAKNTTLFHWSTTNSTSYQVSSPSCGWVGGQNDWIVFWLHLLPRTTKELLVWNKTLSFILTIRLSKLETTAKIALVNQWQPRYSYCVFFRRYWLDKSVLDVTWYLVGLPILSKRFRLHRCIFAHGVHHSKFLQAVGGWTMIG